MKGGWAEKIWRFDGQKEAVPLTADWTGTSTHPMFWNGRVYFLSERDAVMNIYSMNTQGQGLKQEIHQHGFDIESASLSDGRIVYACGSDLWLLDLGTGHEEVIPITLVSDFPDLSWSPDSRWLAYVEPAGNQFVQIKMLNVDSGTIQAITSDRYNR